jgi:hypothetical protein
MKFSLKRYFDRIWPSKNLRSQVTNLQQQVSILEQQIRDLQAQVNKQGGFPAGHYYSPIPAEEDILESINARERNQTKLPGIHLNEKKQQELLREYSQFYKDLPFPDEQGPDCRYYYVNDWYSYADAIFLYSFLRKHQPKRIIEVGSGFTSAVMLDTVDRYFSQPPKITFVEPYPDRLNSLLRKGDEDRVHILTKKIQAVPAELFTSLEPGDLLLVDSTHVVKYGSDVLRLMFDVLPLLPAGIFVHFHDIFYPFEYPSEWLQRGMYWNESYFLRAFLAYNNEWEVYFFSNYAAFAFSEIILEKMPLCAKNSGSSLYITKNAK